MGTLTKQQVTFYGELAKATPYSETPWLNLFERSQAPSQTNKIEFDLFVGKLKMATLKKKYGNGVKLLSNGFARVTIDAGAVEASINLSATDLQEMNSGEREVFINGEKVKTANALIQNKMAILKDALVQKFNYMCAQLINDGRVTFDDGNEYNWNIPTSVAKTWDSSISIIAILHDALRDYRKKNGRMPNKIKVGPKLAQALLTDTEFSGSRDAYTRNVANFDATNTAMVLGMLLNQVIEEADIAVDERGDDLMGDYDLKLFDTTKLVKLYAGIEIINAAGQPDIFAGDWFADIQVEDKKTATAELFGKSAFVPAVTDPETIVSYTITIS